MADANTQAKRLYLIEILHQTTTLLLVLIVSVLLYLIEILHQTTTLSLTMFGFPSCILSKFYIKPQLRIAYPVEAVGCILSKFYIKPQRKKQRLTRLQVVSYRNSTSNHNRYIRPLKRGLLYLIEILHQTTTGYSSGRRPFCCILSKFYIKPQLSASHCLQVWGCILSKFYIKPQRIASTVS